VEDIKKYGVDILVMGSDWRGKFDELRSCCEVVYLPRTEDISTTSLKENLKSFYRIDMDGLKKAMESIEAIVKAME
jgi:glycerol-3-phosphate cytidylyltransferase